MQRHPKLNWHFYYLWADIKYCEGSNRHLCYLAFGWTLTLPSSNLVASANHHWFRSLIQWVSNLGWTQLGVSPLLVSPGLTHVSWSQLLICLVAPLLGVGWGRGYRALCFSWSFSSLAWLYMIVSKFQGSKSWRKDTARSLEAYSQTHNIVTSSTFYLAE